MNLFELFDTVWTTLIGESMPDYIIEAVNWFGFAFIILLMLSPVWVTWVVANIWSKAGRYD